MAIDPKVMSGGLLDRDAAVLGAAIEARNQRASVIAGNIANAETPGFRPKEVDFKSLLEGNLAGEGAPNVVQTDDRQPGRDGNSVSLHRQMANLSENALQQDAAIRLLNKKLDILRFAVSDGRR